MECIVHFRVMHPEEPKELRGLIMLESGGKPGIDQITDMFKDMGYNVRPDNPEELIFKPVDAGADYTYIRVIELDTGEEVYHEDRNLRAILENLLNIH
ncbi:hypothetical protein ACFQ5D_04820 [Paenibacillus farraposensis]|uniref:Uncharacterized protein n=1 Tax=Paenibacillus farraposensis TaxID=2807095 RepID=A0ABW4D7R1_9BACL|nr:hypothetical protein [Paenibacillus farraposensis]MCC3379048.1 hypothetical protein [Paenibacillus farraposensis]